MKLLIPRRSDLSRRSRLRRGAALARGEAAAGLAKRPAIIKMVIDASPFEPLPFAARGQ